MKGFPVMVAALLVSGAMALAQVYSPGTVIVPGSTTYPAGVSVVPMTSVTSSGAAVSSDTALILNEIRALRADVRSTAITVQGLVLTSRINSLMAQEMAFRQAIATNPNLPNSQLIAFQLTAEAQALNKDIAGFTTELSMIPPDQRPYMVQSLNTFDVAFWQPTITSFNNYQAQFATAGAMYQPAYAANPWLQNWVTGYQTSLNTLSQTPQVFASVRWWNQPMVLGTTEVFPMTGQPLMSGQTMVLPSGAVIFIPAQSAVFSAGSVVVGTMPGVSASATPNITTPGTTTETPAY